jgi:transcriptional regulator with XRE-family HTH domain
MAMTKPGRSAFGALLKTWRGMRGLSQLELSLRVETTTRHLSYLENGKSRPGRELVLRLGDALDLPLRSRNELLVVAGLAPEFPASELAAPALEPYRRAIAQVIDAIRPFPAFVVDPTFQLVDANAVGRRLLPGLDPGSANLVDAFLAPGPGRALIQNFDEVAWSWHDRLLRSPAANETAAGIALRKRVAHYLRDVPRPLTDASGSPVLCPTFVLGGTVVRTIGMTLRFGPSRDVTLEELSVDVLCARDDEARRFFETLERTPPG